MNASYTLSREAVVRGEIYYIMPTSTEEDASTLNSGGRPAIIVSNDMINQVSGEVLVVYMSRSKSHTKNLPTDVTITATMEESVALCHRVFTVPRHRIGRFINEVSKSEMEEIEKALALALSAPLDKQTVKEGVELYNRWQTFLEDKMTAAEVKNNKSCPDETANTNTIPTPPAPIQDITLTPEYIKLETERDVFKNLYMDLLKGKIE